MEDNKTDAEVNYNNDLEILKNISGDVDGCISLVEQVMFTVDVTR